MKKKQKNKKNTTSFSSSPFFSSSSSPGTVLFTHTAGKFPGSHTIVYIPSLFILWMGSYNHLKNYTMLVFKIDIKVVKLKFGF
jgi:hypothetical protein